MTKCIECRLLALKAYPQHVAVGFGRCAALPGGSFVKIMRNEECKSFKRDSEDKIAVRVKWLEKREK